MNTRQLPYILAIAAEGSLSGAARRLGLSQPALSKYLNELEKEVGLPLFFRKKRQLLPTRAGTLYMQSAREILSLEDATRRSIALLGTPITQELHIGISPHMGAAILGDIYPAFNRIYPDVRLCPHEGYARTLLSLVRQGDLALCMTSGDGGEGTTAVTIDSEEIGLAVPAFQVKEAAPQADTMEALPFTTLQEHRDSVFIMPQQDSALYAAVQPLFAASNFQPQVAFTTPNISMMQHMIRAGAGIGLVPLRPQTPHPGLFLYRLPHPGFLRSGYYFRTGYKQTEPERYLCFSWLRHRMEHHAPIVWSTYNRALLGQFAPEMLPLLPEENT